MNIRHDLRDPPRPPTAACALRRRTARTWRLPMLIAGLMLATQPAATAQLSDLQPGRNFPTAVNAFGTGRSENIDVGDADNDGDLDVIVANGGDGSAQGNTIYINVGGLQGGAMGSFADETSTRFVGVPNDTSRDIEFVDFDSDFDLDIAVANRGTTTNGGEVSRFYVNSGGLQTGTLGVFFEETSTRWGQLVSVPANQQLFGGNQGPWRGHACDCDFADLDNDGHLDLFQSGYGPNINGTDPSRIFLNDGTGVFDELWPWVNAGADIQLHTLDVDLADLDDDFDIDIVASSRDSQARVYQNNFMFGSGWPGNPFTDITQTALINTGATASGSSNYEVEYADLDGDGDFDVYATNYQSFADRVLRNNGDLTFSMQSSWVKGDPAFDEHEADMIDFDGDGDLDVAMANFSGTNVLYQSGVSQGLVPSSQGLLHRTGTSSGGSLAPWGELPSAGFGFASLDIEAADVDGDGDEDLLLANDLNQVNKLAINTLGVPDLHAPVFHAVTSQGNKPNGSDTVIYVKLRDNSSHYLVAYYPTQLVFEIDDCGEVAVPMVAQGSMQFRGVIPAQIDRNIRYHVVTTDLAGNMAVSADQFFMQGVPMGDDCPCIDLEMAVLDEDGNVVFPDGTDMSTVEYEDTEEDLGFIDELYPDEDTTTDLWNPDFPCTSFGGELPPEASEADLMQELADAGIVGVTPQEIVASLEAWEQQIANKAAMTPPTWPTGSSPSLSTAYTAPPAPHAPDPEECYVMGGADLVFVHGLKTDHLIDKIQGVPEASIDWVTPTVYPGSIENPEYYGNGYFQGYAKGTWQSHISKFLTQRNIKNRYLIVSFSCTTRLDVAAQAILAQIGDAMRYGTGVVDPLDPLGPPPTDFGTPSFVVISQSTGGPLTDVAMAAAAQYPNLGVDYIPGHCKAHIGLHSATSGSRLATAAIVLSGYITTTVPPWLCPLVVPVINQLGNLSISCSALWTTVGSSILLDLVPTVMQWRWGGLIDDTPIRTVTVAGGHPTKLAPFKHIWRNGFDDGVTSVNSQLGNPNPALTWPSGFIPKLPGLIAFIHGYDMGIAKISKRRAVGYFLDQFIEPLLSLFTPPALAAGGAVPHLSPSGMLQRVASGLGSTFYDTRNRYDNHYSFLLSASDHFACVSVDDYPDYEPSAGKPNYEETRVITDPDIYTSYQTAMPYPGDDAPLLQPGSQPRVKHVVRGRKVTFKLFGFKRTWWLWRRHYFLVDGYQSQHEMDYAYRFLLRDPGVPLDCGSPAWVDAGCALGGGFGDPILFGTGDLTTGSPTTVDLGSAAPNSPAMLFVSLGPSVAVPFKCGTLKAIGGSQIIVPGMVTDAAGEIRLSFPWPSGVPSGTKVWVQYAILDASAPCGVALSNALCVTVP